MNIRTAKKILKNKEQLHYNKTQVSKAETTYSRFQKNKKAEA